MVLGGYFSLDRIVYPPVTGQRFDLRGIVFSVAPVVGPLLARGGSTYGPSGTGGVYDGSSTGTVYSGNDSGGVTI